MNLPFSLALTNTNVYGAIWNPWGTTVANSVANAILSGLAADLQERYGLLLSTNQVIITGMAVMADAADAQVTLGIWDTDRGAFDSIYPIGATVVQGGGFVRPFVGSGLCFPVSATRIPCFKLTGTATAVKITGDLDLYFIRDSGAVSSSAIPTPDSNLLAEDGTVLLTDSTLLPLRTG